MQEITTLAIILVLAGLVLTTLSADIIRHARRQHAEIRNRHQR